MNSEKTALALLKRLVEIHSGPENLEGIARAQKVLAAELQRLGFAIKWITNPDRKIRSGRFLLATLQGARSECIDLITHSDTLEPGQALRSPFKVSRDKKTAQGPGVMDDKGGQVVALMGLAAYLKENPGKPPFTIRYFSAPSEEQGSPGFQKWLWSQGQKSKLVLGFEPCLDDGSIIHSRRGNRWYQIEVEGREAHSGRAHRHGVNAALELAKKLVDLSALTDYARDVTVSVGHMQAGRDSYNVVAGSALAKIDTRFSKTADGDALDQKIKNILLTTDSAPADDGLLPKIRYQLADDCPPFEPHPKVGAMLNPYFKAVHRLEGRPIVGKKSGGGADSCYMSRPDLMIIDGLGPRGGRMHSIDEFVDLQSITSRAKAFQSLLQYAMEQLK